MRIEDYILRGTRAAQPAAAAVSIGALYCVTDEGNLVERSSGAAWQAFSPSGLADGSVTTAKLADGAVTTIKIADANVTNAKLANMAALTVKANATNGAADPADLAAGASGQVLRRRGTALEFAALTTAAAIAAPPASPAVGDLHFTTDSQILRRHNGTLWQAFGPIGAFTEPIDGDYAWINQGGASVSAASGGILLTAPATAGDSLRIRKKAAPAAPYVLTAYMQPIAGKRASATYGIGFRQSSDGKLHLLMLHQHDAGSIFSIKFTNETTFSATYTSSVMNTLDLHGLPPKWLRIADDNTNRILSVSVNGVDWHQFHSIGRADFLTADELLFFANASDAAVAETVRLLSWLQT